MIYILLIGALAVGDLRLKQWIDEQAPEQFPRPWARSKGKIVLHRHHNPGFPFGFLQKYGAVVRMVPLAVVSALGGALAYLLPRKGRTLQKLGLAIVIGGALSNLYDRLVKHYVVDYFSFSFGPLKRVIFNLGDLCVFLGSAILMVWEFVSENRKKGAAAGGDGAVRVKSVKSLLTEAEKHCKISN